MNVEVLEATENPEELACYAARNDYYDDYIMDDDFAEVMASVDYDDEHYEKARNRLMEETDDWDLYDEARVEEEAKKQALVEQLIDREHWGVFEHPQLTFSLEGVSRVTMAQMTRHRHLSFDVQSMRYVDFEDADAKVPPTLDDDEVITRELGLTDLDDDVQEEYRERYKELTDDLFEFYEDAVEDGVPKEDARYAIPLGTPVNIVASGNLRAWLHVLNLRQAGNVQPETRELANEMGEELEDWAPIVGQYFEEKGPFHNGI